MADSKFDLGDYVEVKDRIAKFYELFGQGRLVTDGYMLTREPDDKPKVIVKALAFRTPDDPHPGVGLSWMYLPGSTPYTKGSELENVETSAWGRAIGSLGILILRSIATGNEIRAKAGEADDTNGGLIGTVVKQKAMTTDFAVRQSPDGPFLGFRLAAGAGAGVICEVRGPLAEALALLEADVIGQRVQVWGEFVQYEPPTVKHAYRAFRVSRIQTPTGTIPAAEGEPGQAPEAQAATEPPTLGDGDGAPADALDVPHAAGGSVKEPNRANPSAPPAEKDAEDYAAFQRANPSLELLPDEAA